MPAILAGADLLLTTDPESCFRALHDAVRAGRLPASREIDDILGERADAHGATLLTVPMARNYDPSSSEVSDGEVALVERLSSQMPVSVISFGNPYALSAFRTTSARGCAYGADPAAIDVAIAVIAGRLRPHGQLPVEIPGL